MEILVTSSKINIIHKVQLWFLWLYVCTFFLAFWLLAQKLLSSQLKLKTLFLFYLQVLHLSFFQQDHLEAKLLTEEKNMKNLNCFVNLICLLLLNHNERFRLQNLYLLHQIVLILNCLQQVNMHSSDLIPSSCLLSFLFWFSFTLYIFWKSLLI